MPRGEAFDLVGGSWKKGSELMLSAYLGRLKDTWRTAYLGAQYTRPLRDQRSLAMDVQIYRSQDTGKALAGPVDTSTASWLGTYRQGPHRMALGWQKVMGNTPFDYVSRGAIWLGNAMQLSDFNAPHEQSWQLRYEFDATTWGASGLSVGTAYTRGSGTDGSRMPSGGGYAWLGYGQAGKHWERDLWLRYKIEGGAAKGLAVLLRYSVHRANKAQAELNTDQIRLTMEYPLEP